MSEPIQTTLEEASRCPRCNSPTKFVGEKPIRTPSGEAKLKTFVCVNSRCVWYNDVAAIVQVNSNGSIPPPVTDREKFFPKLPGDGGRILENLEAQLRRETSGGGEVPNRRR